MLILTKTRSTHCSVQFSLYSACLVSKFVNLSVPPPPSPPPPPFCHRSCFFSFPFCHVTLFVCCFSASVMSHRWCVVFPLLSCHTVGVLFFRFCHVTPLVCCFSFCHVTPLVCCFSASVMSHRWCVVVFSPVQAKEQGCSHASLRS